MGLGLAVTLAGFIIGLAAPGVPCQPGVLTPQLTFGGDLVLIGAVLQAIPVVVALIGRRRWRTTLAIGVILLLMGTVALVAEFWPSPKLVPDGSPAIGIIPGLAALALSVWLYSRAAGGRAQPPLSVLQANMFTVGAVILFTAALGAGITAGFRHFCIYW